MKSYEACVEVIQSTGAGSEYTAKAIRESCNPIILEGDN